MGISPQPIEKVAAPCESTNSEESSSSLAYLAVESQASSLYCRVCWDTTDSESLISPCSCKGTQKYVHVKCLRRWQENVQKRNLRDERAFRCGVCQVRYTLAPPDPRFTTKLFQILRGLGGAACISLLAFGLAGPPWPHLALLTLVLLGSRSHGMVAFALLTAGTILAALHAKGLRLVMKFDDVGSPFGFSVVRHGAPVPGLGPGTLLVANNDLNHSIFRQSVVLIYEHDIHGGARGVILTQPMSSYASSSTASSSSSFAGGRVVVDSTDASTATPRGSVLRTKNQYNKLIHQTIKKETNQDGGGVGGGNLIPDDDEVDNNFEIEAVGEGEVLVGGKKRYVGTEEGSKAVQHRLGGPVGMPGEGARQEIAVLHSVTGIDGATAVILGDGQNTPSVYIGGKLTDVLEIGKEICDDAIRSSSILAKIRGVDKNKIMNKKDDGISDNADVGNIKEGGKRSGTVSNWICDGPAVLVFHGISTWAEGQLEGEIRAGSWAYGDAAVEDILSASPDELWSALMRSDRVSVLV